MTLHQLISKAYCINLYYRSDRWAHASTQFAAAGLNVERFNAIDGWEFKTKYKAPPGNCGCNLSHMLIMTAAKHMGLPAIMVFEDDPVLREHFIEGMDRCLADLPADWELVMLAGTHREKPEPVTENIYRVKRSLCSHAYIMRESAYDYFLDGLLQFNGPLDGLFVEFQKKGTTYVTNPPMTWQLAGHSDIEGRVMRYDHLQSNFQ